MKYIILLIFLFLFNFAGYSQSLFQIKGAVSDTSSKGKLTYTSISVLNAKDSILRKFAWADNNGEFSISNLSKGKFILLISYPGYVDYVEPFTLDSLNKTHDFGKINMLLKAKLLGDVIIKGSRTQVKIKGDTTEFNAKAFVIQPNDKVEDLLKKLPGIEIDKDGKITAQGQTVTKVLVDGEEFFGDDPTLVTKNLRADMVDKVQLYDKKSDQASFTGIDDGVKTKTINIKLKEDKKNGVFGKVTGGVGNSGYYEGQALYNKFKANQKFSAYGTIANDGKVGLGFSDNDKLGTSGNNVQIGDDGGVSIFFSSSDDLDSFDGSFNGRGLPFARTGGLHYDSKLNNGKATLNTNYKIGVIDVTGVTATTSQQNVPTGVFNNSSSQTFDNHSFRQKFDATYQVKPDTSTNVKISADGTVKSFTVDNNYATSSYGNDTLVNRSNRRVTNDGTQKLLNASVLFTRKFTKPRRTFSWNVSEAYNQNDTKGYLNSEIDFFNKAGAQDSVQKINQYKTVSTTSSALNSNITYSEPITTTLSVSFNYGLGINNSDAVRKSFNQNGTGLYDILDTTYSNNYHFNQLTNQLGAVFTYKKRKVTLNFGAKASDINFKQINEISGITTKRDFINWLPQANLQYRFSQRRSFQFNYSGSTSQPTLDQIQPVKVNNDPLNIVLGNAALKPSFSNRLGTSYNSYKVLSGLSFYGSANFSFTADPIINNSFTDATGKTTTQYVNLTGKTPYNYSLYLNTGRKLGSTGISIGFNGSTYGSVSYSYINSLLNMSQTISYSAGLSIQKYVEKKYNFYIQGGPSYSINEFSTQPQNNNNAPGLNAYSGFGIYLPWKLTLNGNARYLYSGKTAALPENSRTIANANIEKSFFKDENLKFSLGVNNLFNQDVNFNRNVSANTITQTTSTSIKRFFLLTVSWDFTKFGTTAAKN